MGDLTRALIAQHWCQRQRNKKICMDFKTAVSQQGNTKDVAAHVNERRHAITDVVVWAA
jgi:hypothetical protein